MNCSIYTMTRTVWPDFKSDLLHVCAAAPYTFFGPLYPSIAITPLLFACMWNYIPVKSV